MDWFLGFVVFPCFDFCVEEEKKVANEGFLYIYLYIYRNREREREIRLVLLSFSFSLSISLSSMRFAGFQFFLLHTPTYQL
jgi:hypothetical protein